MRELAIEGSQDPIVRALAVDLTRWKNAIAQKDYRAETCALFEYCRDRIRYVRDIRDAETLHTARAVLQTGSGDCDDKSILLAALLLSIGHSPRFIAVALKRDQFSHVWVQDNIRGQWVDLDPTEPLECGNRIPQAGVVDTMTLAV